MRFIVDSMLGDIARWLRMLGYDTLYSRKYEDWEILKIADRDGRIIITRDIGLFNKARKKGLKVVYVEPSSISDMLASIARKTGLELYFKPNKTRCPYCNTELEVLAKAEALSLVPSFIGVKYDRFWCCPKCNKVFWQGRHWKTINSILESAKMKVGR